jgi:hypothetical protein
MKRYNRKLGGLGFAEMDFGGFDFGAIDFGDWDFSNLDFSNINVVNQQPTTPPTTTPTYPSGANTSGSASTNIGASNSSESLPYGVYVPMNNEKITMICKGVYNAYIEGAKYIADVMNNRIQAITGAKFLKIDGQVQEIVAGNIYTNTAVKLDKLTNAQYSPLWEFSFGVYNPSLFGNQRFKIIYDVGLQTAYKLAYAPYIDGSYLDSYRVLTNEQTLLAATKWLALFLASEDWQRPYGTCDENQLAIDNGTTTDNQFNNELIDSLKEQAAFAAAERDKIIAEAAQAKLLEETRAANFKLQQENDRIQEEILARQRLVDVETARQNEITFQRNQEAERLRFEAEIKLREDERNNELANRLAREAAEREAAERAKLMQAGNAEVIRRDVVGVAVGTQIYNKPADWTKKDEPTLKPTTKGTQAGGREEEGGVTNPDEESFWDKYKWWVIGGAATVLVVGGGTVAYKMSNKKPKVGEKTPKVKKGKK